MATYERYENGSLVESRPLTSEEEAARVAFPEVRTVGLVRFTVAAGVVTTTDDTSGFAAVSRLSVGRYRAFYSVPDPDLRNLPDYTIRDAADRRGRVSARTSAHVEIRTLDSAGAAADVQELTIRATRVM